MSNQVTALIGQSEELTALSVRTATEFIAKTEPMPTNACQFFYECTGCGAMLRPNQGDCCVFCGG
jgi:hypothetical protein